MAVSARPNLAMCWAQRRPPATTAPSESPDESDLESELHIDLDRGCSATPDPPEPGTPPIDGGAISKSAFNSGRAAGMREPVLHEQPVVVCAYSSVWVVPV